MSYRRKEGTDAAYPYGDVEAASQYPVTRHQAPSPPVAYYVPVPYYPVVDPYKAAKDAEDAAKIAKLIWALAAACVICAVIGVIFIASL